MYNKTKLNCTDFASQNEGQILKFLRKGQSPQKICSFITNTISEKSSLIERTMTVEKRYSNEEITRDCSICKTVMKDTHEKLKNQKDKVCSLERA